MTSSAKITGLIILTVIILIGASSIYTINEGEHGILLRLGKLTKDAKTGDPAVYPPGLHFKIPVITQARLFDTRLQTLDIQSSRIMTKELKDVLVDYFIKWRIEDVPLYFTRTGGNELQAQTLLEQQLNNSLRAQFGNRTISEVVSGERADIMGILQQQANETANGLGIEVIDVRIKRIDLPAEVSAAVFERMRTERQRIANQHRADGRGEANAIQARADAEVTVILATARKQGQGTRGEGDAEATKIYAKAYSKGPEFYAFYRSLNAYQEAFDSKQDILVLKPDGEFFQYFNKTTGASED